MKEVNYKQGMTSVWSDGEKIIITNPSGKKYIETNVDQIFGLGEFAKIDEVKYSEEVGKSVPYNLSKKVTITSGYIPQKVKKDLEEQSLPGIKESDLVREYFK